MNKRFWLIIFFLTAFLLRFYKLDNIPPHLRNDEAALGYNAYSVLTTGHDEHGNFMPILFQSFGDWKPGLYIYSIIPFVEVLGLNELAVRLPSALAGLITVYIIYLITFQIFSSKRISLIAAMLVAISPWAIAFSRGGWEANLSLTLTLAGIYFFLKTLSNPRFFILSVISFALTFLTYHGAKISSPLVLFSLSIVYWKEITRLKKSFLISSLILGLLISLPIIFSFFDGKLTRINYLSITNLSAPKYVQADPLFAIYHNPFITNIRNSLGHWSEYFSITTFFIKGDNNPQHTAPNTGAFIILDLLFLILGLFKIINLKFTKEVKFLLLWMITAPISSSLTIESANFVRILPFFIPLTMVMAVGVNSLHESFISKVSNKLHFSIFILLSYLVLYVVFLDSYFIHGPKKNGAWQYGYKQIVQKVNTLKSGYKKIYVTDGPDTPYIFFLFYQGADPKIQYIGDVTLYPTQSLYVLPVNKVSQVSADFKVIDQVKDLNGFPIYQLIEIK